MTSGDGEPQAHPPAGPSHPPGPAVVRPARSPAPGRTRRGGAASPIGCGRSASSSAASSVGVGVVRRWRRRPRPVVAVVRRRRPGRRRSRLAGPGRLAARSRLALAQLFQEVVEQVAHRVRSLPAGSDQGRWSPSMARAKPARTVSASSFGAHRGRPGGLEPERGADRQRGPPRPARIVRRRDQAEPHLEPPGILEDQPGQGAADARSEARERRVGRRPAAGATSRKLTTPSSSTTQRTASHQPSGASVGRAMPARSVRSPMRIGCSRR